MNYKRIKMMDMANLPPKRTGLPYQVWYSAKVPGHQPRVKVSLPDDESLSIEINNLRVRGAVKKISAKDLEKLKKWVTLNKDILIKYWNEAETGEIDNVDVYNALKRV